MGIRLDTDEKGNFYKKIYCHNCNMVTVHRKLKSLEILDDTKVRNRIPIKLAKKIKEVLNYEEAVFLRKMPSRELEIDHKFPQIKWKSDEEENKVTMSEEEIREIMSKYGKYELLKREYQRFKADKNREYKDTKTYEYLHILKK
jgi:hypothetical protein